MPAGADRSDAVGNPGITGTLHRRRTREGEPRGAAARSIRAARGSSGFTLIELVSVMAVLGILAVWAVPSFDDFRVRARVGGAANNMFADLQYARSEAVQKNARMAVSFTTGASWCYGIHQGNAPCDCTTPASCSIKAVSSVDYPNVSVSQAQFTSNSGTNTTYYIDPRRGQSVDAAGSPVAGNVVFSGSGSRALRGDLNAVGRVRLCSPSGSISGYPTC
jgi:type IV fimbrial biogenesis protein FimT